MDRAQAVKVLRPVHIFLVSAQTSQKRCCGLRDFQGTTAALVGAVGCALALPQGAKLACALRSSSSQKSRSAFARCDFWEPCNWSGQPFSPLRMTFKGSLIISHAHSPLSDEPNVFGKLRALSEKRGFRTRNLIIKNNFAQGKSHFFATHPCHSRKKF